MVRARRYPWGIVEVENEDHCDFVKLREALLRTNVDAMREKTHNASFFIEKITWKFSSSNI